MTIKLYVLCVFGILLDTIRNPENYDNELRSEIV